jgi:hypothetical protein
MSVVIVKRGGTCHIGSASPNAPIVGNVADDIAALVDNLRRRSLREAPSPILSRAAQNIYSPGPLAAILRGEVPAAVSEQARPR